MAETSFSTEYLHQPDTSASELSQPSHSGRQIGRGYQKTIVVSREPEKTQRQNTAAPPTTPGDNHLTISVIVLVVSALFCNVFALLCAVPAVLFSIKARKAELQGRKDAMREDDRTAFGFVIFAIIGWILSVCIAGFIVYNRMCGISGQLCTTATLRA